MVAAILSEAKYAAAMWSGDPATARRELEKTIDRTATDDARLSGWHSVWLGAAYEVDGDRDAAYREYGVAMRRLNRSMTLPRPTKSRSKDPDIHKLNEFGESLRDITSYPEGAGFEAEVRKKTDMLAFIASGTPNQAEAGVRQLGELLGFRAIRPDNDEGTGPDVLWLCESELRMIGFELKTNKDDPTTYYKKDISKGHDHLEWMRTTYNTYALVGLLYVGPVGSVDERANPSDLMGLSKPQTLVNLAKKVLALIEDIRKHTPIERIAHIPEMTKDHQWGVDALWRELRDEKLSDL